jgi:hypothetical protein
MCTSITTHAFANKAVKIPALETNFLLYLAEMDNIDNQWFDPLTLEQATNEQNSKATENNEVNKAMNVTVPFPTKNENATDEGVK